MAEIESKLAAALVAFQGDLVPVAKSATNPFFKSKYAPLPEVMETIQPLLAKHKLAVVQMMTNIDGQSALSTMVLHESGDSISAVSPLLLPKSDPQGQGSAVTYARRYALMSALGVVADEDDDGNLASKARKAAQSEPDKPAEQSAEKKLARAKAEINEALEAQGYTLPVRKKTFITRVLDQSTIDTLEQAHEVMDALDNEREDV